MPIKNEEQWYRSYNESQHKYGWLKQYWNLLHLRKMRFFTEVAVDAVIVDIGCGNGNVLRTLQRNGYKKLYGFDVRIPEKLMNNGIVFKKGSMLDVPYPQDFADVLICFNVMHHLLNEHEYHVFLSQCQRVLKHDGKFFLVEPENNFFRKCQSKLIALPIISEIGPIKAQKIAVFEEKEELEYFMGTDIRALVQCHNFNIIRYQTFLKSFILYCSTSGKISTK